MGAASTQPGLSDYVLSLEQGDLGISTPAPVVNPDGTVTLPGSLPWWVWAGLGLGAFLILKGLVK